MQTRRTLLRNGFLLAGAAGTQGILPGSIQKALAITPDPGTTYLNAEHIVILMQENRSFDHMFGTLSGVRGFNDRRTMRQADGASVFIQRDRIGTAYLPWRASLKDTKITWMGDTPHARSDHLDAWNGGTHNNWVTAKANRRFPEIPATMAYHTRGDLPFYYALADAFTVCDQNFAGSLTETAPNRLFLWSGTVRERHETGALAYLKNGQTQPGALSWTSFPERLEQAGISWKFYQNDSWCESPLSSEDATWLGNDGDNTIERFAAVKPNFSPQYRQHTIDLLDGWQERVRARKAELEARLRTLDPSSPEATDTRRWIAAYEAQDLRLDRKRDRGNTPFAQLTPAEQSLHSKVMTTNSGDADFRSLETIRFTVDGRSEQMRAPKGDVLHQFRSDVRTGDLPTVSWLVAAANFSAHPSVPFYGAWYISEIMDILTENPEVWKKTIFIVTFDENDGLFDHVPPFVACDPRRPETGKVSEGLDPAPEYAYAEDERIQGTAEKDVRDGPIGLGFRVPMIVASPWSRGGWVNSQIFEHSSIIQFVEHFVAAKFGENVRQEEISAWRRAISGDLTSCFRAFDGHADALTFLNRDRHLVAIEQAKFRPLPDSFSPQAASQYATADAQARLLRENLWQEEGVRQSCALPYELTADGRLSADGKHFEIRMEAADHLFGPKAVGAPFNLYLHGVRTGSRKLAVHDLPDSVATAHYAVKAGDMLHDTIRLDRFVSNVYDIELFGPNGFYRRFAGKRGQLHPAILCMPVVGGNGAASAASRFTCANPSDKAMELTITSDSYFEARHTIVVPPRATRTATIPLHPDHSWYDLSISLTGVPEFLQTYAGRIETGRHSVSDPAMTSPAGSKKKEHR